MGPHPTKTSSSRVCRKKGPLWVKARCSPGLAKTTLLVSRFHRDSPRDLLEKMHLIRRHQRTVLKLHQEMSM